MSKGYKAFLGALLVICVLLLPAAAEEPRQAAFSLPPELKNASALAAFPDGDGGFVLLARESQGTQLFQLDAPTGESAQLGKWNLPYTAWCRQGERLYFALPTMEFSSADNQFHRQTQLVSWALSQGEPQIRLLPDCYPALEQDFAVGADGSLFVIDSENRARLQRFDADGDKLEPLAAPEPLSAIVANQQMLCALGIQSGRLYLVQGDEFLPLEACAPALPLRLLEDGTLLDGNGDAYRWNPRENRFEFAYSVFCPPALCDQIDNTLLTCWQDALLLVDLTTGAPLGQQNGPENAEQLCVSGGWAISLCRQSNGDYGAAFFGLDALGPVRWQVTVPQGGVGTESELMELWQAHLPVGRKPEEVYEQAADLTAFTTPGLPAGQTLEDGLTALNFYRTLYGLSPTSLNEEDCHSLQYGAVLALFEQRPADMPDQFYQFADCEACRLADSARFSSLPGAPMAQAVHLLWQEQEFAELLLASQADCMSMGCASDGAGSTAVLVYGAADSAASLQIAEPPPGVYAISLLKEKPWRITLGELQTGLRGSPTVTVTDENTGKRWSFSTSNGLTVENGALMFPPPAQAAGSYLVCAENLSTPTGAPAKMEYHCTLSDVELPWPNSSGQPQPGEESISSTLYRIDRAEGILTGIAPSTTLAACKKNLAGDGELRFLREGKPVASGNVGTGMAVQLVKDGVVVDSLNLLVYGDLTGEGNCNTLDRRAFYAHLLEESPLQGLFLQAGDLNRDGIVDTLDLLALQKYLTGGYELSP